MGQLSPLCLAANTDSIYFIAQGQTYTDDPTTTDRTQLGQKLWVLVKSVGDPTTTINNLSWSVISTLPFDMAATAGGFEIYSENPSRDLACTVDKDGVFSFGHIGGQYVSGNVELFRTSFKAMQFNPTLAINPQLNSTRADLGAKTGEWRFSSEPSQEDHERDYTYTMVLGTASASDKTLRNYHLSSVQSVFKPYPSGPILSLVEADFPNRTAARPKIRSLPLDIPLGGIVDLVYGNDNLYAVHEHGDPMPRPENPRMSHYSRTLRVYPYKNLGDMSTAVVASSRVDWTFSCRDRSASAAAGGQYYFLCKRFIKEGSPAEYGLYTSNGTTVQGPFTTTQPFKAIDPTLISLTPIYPKQPPQNQTTTTAAALPQYGILLTLYNELFALNLQPDQLSQPWIPLKPFSVSEKIRNYQRPEVTESGCSERCYGERVALGLKIGLPLGLLVLVLCCVGCITHLRRRQLRREREANGESAIVGVKGPVASEKESS